MFNNVAICLVGLDIYTLILTDVVSNPGVISEHYSVAFQDSCLF